MSADKAQAEVLRGLPQSPALKWLDEETIAFIDLVLKEKFNADADVADAICDGSVDSARKAGQEKRAVQRIYDAIPTPILNEYFRRKRKAAADALRKKADDIEAGKEPI